ncbi:glutamate--tRNA ligase [Myxococcota bacterium]|nr:glutamate--tRNA ligase [Myxococcota bacterium]
MVRCRFAPSPTGRLHVGGARTALFNLLFARRTGGTMILRIEDTDQLRSSLASERLIFEDLRWLGIVVDESPEVGGPYGPYRQSERLERYREVAEALIRSGHAYEAWETNEELDALRRRAEGSAQGALRYRRRPTTPEQVAAYRAEGRQPVVRLQAAGIDQRFVDLILGEVSVAAEDLEDFVILKGDGFPTYHFAVVVDDHDMHVTHVLRAQEHLLNTTKHLAINQALGWTPPEHGHMPLIFSMEGGKMSKRDKAKTARAKALADGHTAAALAARTGLDEAVLADFLAKKTDDVELALAIGAALKLELPEIDVVDFRAAGYLPEALVNFLALLGWNAGEGDRELYSLDELGAAFSLERVGSTAARFDRDKLRWMNGVYIRQSSDERLLRGLREYAALNETPLAAASDETLLKLISLYKERATTLRELDLSARFFFERPTEWGPEKSLKKQLLNGRGLPNLAAARDALAAQDDWSEGALEALIHGLAEARCEGKLGELAQPLRIAVSGGPVSPPLFGVLALLGKAETLARIDACAARFGASA